MAKNTQGNIAKSFSGSSGAIILLSVAYAANIGGTAFVTGTPPNLVAFKILDGRVTFPSWMGFASKSPNLKLSSLASRIVSFHTVPLALVNIILCWLYLRSVVAIFNWMGNSNEITPSIDSEVPLSNVKMDSPKKDGDQHHNDMDPRRITRRHAVDCADQAEDIKAIINKHLKVMRKLQG